MGQGWGPAAGPRRCSRRCRLPPRPKPPQTKTQARRRRRQQRSPGPGRMLSSLVPGPWQARRHRPGRLGDGPALSGTAAAAGWWSADAEDQTAAEKWEGGWEGEGELGWLLR
jgi:hypothetical protein